MYLNPSLELYDLSIDPGESKLVHRDIVRKLRGMSVLFQQEMLADARPPGRVKVLDSTDGKTYLPQSTLDELNAKLDLTYANYGDRSLAMDE